MVELLNNFKEWFTSEDMKKLGFDAKAVDVLFRGLCVTKNTEKGYEIVNKSDFIEYLEGIKKILDIFNYPIEEKKSEEPHKRTKWKGCENHLTGKQAAKKKSCSLQLISYLIRYHSLEAKRAGLGYLIDQQELDGFFIRNHNLIVSLMEKEKDGTLFKDEDKIKRPFKLSNQVPSVLSPQKDKDETKENHPEIVPEKKLEKLEDIPFPQNNINKELLTIIPEKNEENEIEKNITIKIGKYGYKIDDVALSVGVPIKTVMRWIDDGAVKVTPQSREITNSIYIEKNSLDQFLLKHRKTIVMSEECKGQVKNIH